MDPQPAGRSREGSLLFFSPRQEICFISRAGRGTASNFLRRQSGGSVLSPEDVMESGDSSNPDQRNLDQWNVKERKRISADTSNGGFGLKGAEKEVGDTGIFGGIAILIQEKLSPLSAPGWKTAPAWEPGRGGMGCEEYPAIGRFYPWAYAGAVHILFFDGECLPDSAQ